MIKQNTRQRLEYIELMAFYTGVVARSDLVRSFGLSDPAATKILKQYNELVPNNLQYQQNVFGFVPTEGFTAHYSDLSPAAALPLIEHNLAAPGPSYNDQPIYGIAAEALPMPTRLPSADVLAQITRAIKQKTRLEVSYHSMSDRSDEGERLIEPHALVNTGLRWHVRAYYPRDFDFRDFVLSRITEARQLGEPVESGMEYDEAWIDILPLELVPHPGLSRPQQATIALDYGMTNNSTQIEVRRALIGYLLQRLAVDTTPDQSLNPKAYPLVLRNRGDIEPFAGWAFHSA